MEKALISALKRNDRKDFMAAYLDLQGKVEAADEVRAASRVTNALIDRVFNAPEEVVEEAEVPTSEVTEESLIAEAFADVEKLIAKGKKKKAKKAIKNLEATGHKGSVLDNLKKKVKEL